MFRLPQLNSSQRRASCVLLVLVSLVIGWQLKSRLVTYPTPSAPEVACTEAVQLLDLNTADAAALDALPGIGPVLSDRILKYRESLCGFVAVEELQKVYGLKPETYAQIANTLTLSPADRSQCRRFAPKSSRHTASASPEYPSSTSSLPPQQRIEPSAPKSLTLSVDLNQADSLQLLSVPGIGAKTAGRIVKFRDKLGFFTHVDQVKEVYGVSDENFNRMRDHIQVSPTTGKGIKINLANKDQLGRHPYVGFKNATILLAYHDEHGNFSSVEDLRQVNGLDWERLEKAIPYLEF